MRPFKATPRQEKLKWEKEAEPVFQAAYEGQRKRIQKVIRRTSPETIQAELLAQWELEPAEVKRAVQSFYDRLMFEVGEDAINGVPINNLDWDMVNEALFEESQQRAGWFANAMTETSIRQTQGVVTDWLDTEGATLQELVDRTSRVWTGPRADVAAVTETTNLVAQARDTAWVSSGVVWGYNVNTMNDGHQRETHQEVADAGPYPLSDKTHLPPVNGDPNCRCFTSPVVDDPNDIN